MAKNKLDYLAEALAEFGLSGASQLPASVYGGYKAATTPGGFADRLRAFQQGAEDLTYQPRGAAAQDVYGAIAENTPEALSRGLSKYSEWSAENPTLGLVADAALGTVGGGAGRALKREIFRGPRAGNADEMKAADAAYDRIKAGEDPAAIWAETGWGLHPKTGQRITEVDDSGLKVKMIPTPRKTSMALEQSIEHPELFDVTPSARTTTISREEGRGGTFYPSEDKIAIGSKADLPAWKDTLVHELDHRTAKEFFLPKGGSPSQFGYGAHHKRVETEGKALASQLRTLRDTGVITPDDASKIIDTVNQAGMTQSPVSLAGVFDASKLPKAEHSRLVKTLAGWNEGMAKKNEAYEKYRNISGEAMARLTTKRRQLSASERREDYPFDPNYFARLTGSRIEDLTDPVGSGGPQ